MFDPFSSLFFSYKGQQAGEYYADLLVEGCVIVELKACVGIAQEHVAQCLHYLAATRLPVCLLLNFSRTVSVKRLVSDSFGKLGTNESVQVCARLWLFF